MSLDVESELREAMSDTVQKTADGEEATFYFLGLDLVGCCMFVLDFRYF